MSRPPLTNSPKVSKSRKAAHLSALLDHRLAVYALAAGAVAGASAMAFGQTAEAQLAHVAPPNVPLDNTIVYTPANIPMYIGIGVRFYSPPPITVDLNGDGVPDVSVRLHASGYSRGGTGRTSRYQAAANWYAIGGNAGVKRPIAPETEIGPNLPFADDGLMVKSEFIDRSQGPKVGCYGPFVNHGGGYWGVRFSISGENHYGWIRLSFTCGYYVISGTITGYAYQTVANQPIGAGQMQSQSGEKNQADDPATLGVLSLGSAGLPFWRP
ncbi:MAG: hypothetical protein WAL56_01650 [Candidatus Sulfotelmatobacter sp.]